uniref:Tectonic domain-containing protein n=1 Tax=Denticeps clupeoides TaxID=299321 RepID=A0AAY4EEJ0_9TELE
MGVLWCVFLLLYYEGSHCSVHSDTGGDQAAAENNSRADSNLQNVTEPPRDPASTVPALTEASPPEEATVLPEPPGTTDAPQPADKGLTPTTQPELSVVPGQSGPLADALPSPAVDAATLCPCDLQIGGCDANCCCDPDCAGELALFTSCSVQKVIVNPRLCSQNVATYALSSTADGYADVQSSIQREVNPDVFCIQSANYEAGLSYAEPAVATVDNFDKVFARFVRFFFGNSKDSSASDSGIQTMSPAYLYGDAIITEDAIGTRQTLRLPASAGTAYCLDASPAAFLKDQMSTCIRNLDLARDCTTFGALNLQAYVNLSILSDKTKDAILVPVEVVSITLQSLDGTQTLVDVSNISLYDPVLQNLSAGDSVMCSNVVLQVWYTVIYSGVGEVLNMIAAVTLGTITSTMLPMQQYFQIEFKQVNVFNHIFIFLVHCMNLIFKKTMLYIERKTNYL